LANILSNLGTIFLSFHHKICNMIKALRDDYNKNFTQVKYNEYLADINKTYVPIHSLYLTWVKFL